MSMDERFIPACVPDRHDIERRLKADERELLLRTARLLAELVIWKNIDGRTDALAVLDVVKRIESARSTIAGVASGSTVASKPVTGTPE